MSFAAEPECSGRALGARWLIMAGTSGASLAPWPRRAARRSTPSLGELIAAGSGSLQDGRQDRKGPEQDDDRHEPNLRAQTHSRHLAARTETFVLMVARVGLDRVIHRPIIGSELRLHLRMVGRES